MLQSDLMVIGYLKELSTLSLADCKLSDRCFQVIRQNVTNRLIHLNLLKNQDLSEECLFNNLSCLPQLKKILITPSSLSERLNSLVCSINL